MQWNKSTVAKAAFFKVYCVFLRRPRDSIHVLNTEDLLITKDGIPSGRVATKGEDVGVVSRDHSQSVRLSGQLCGAMDGLVEHHGFRQSQFGDAVVVAVIDSAS